MLRMVDTTVSCGIKLLAGEVNYKTAETYFKDLATYHFNPDMTPKHQVTGLWSARTPFEYTVFIWTHAPAQYTIGSLMKDYIEKHKLGTVVVSEAGENPVHKGRKIAVWVWTRDNAAFAAHCEKLL